MAPGGLNDRERLRTILSEAGARAAGAQPRAGAWGSDQWRDIAHGVLEPAVQVLVDDVAPVGLRPLRLLPRPMEIGVTAVVPEGAPIAFRFHGTQHTVAQSVGPERIETGWWRGPHTKRDYYRVVTQAGRRCWLFRNRDTGRWFLHGWFDSRS